jgi:hypothetical protein
VYVRESGRDLGDEEGEPGAEIDSEAIISSVAETRTFEWWFRPLMSLGSVANVRRPSRCWLYHMLQSYPA